MGLKATRGKKYQIAQIFPRHFIQTAKAVGFDTATMADIMNEIANSVDSVITKVNSKLPQDFPVHIRDTILDGLKDRSRRLLN
ncbi:Serine/threonine-protein kinase HipA [Shewanella livingstonensis]